MVMDAQPVQLPSLAELFGRVARAGHLQETISLDEFFEPAEEGMEEEPPTQGDQDALFEEICKPYLTVENDELKTRTRLSYHQRRQKRKSRQLKL